MPHRLCLSLRPRGQLHVPFQTSIPREMGCLLLDQHLAYRGRQEEERLG